MGLVAFDDVAYHDDVAGDVGTREPNGLVVGRCRLTVSKPVLKAPMVSALEAII